LEEENFNIGDYTAQCKTDYYSPSDAKAVCDVTKGKDPRAKFEFEVFEGKVLKADAEMSRKIFDELKGDDEDSQKEIDDIKDFMDKRHKDKITLTVLESEEKTAEAKGIWSDVASGFDTIKNLGRK